jgi:hypothetical protein
VSCGGQPVVTEWLEYQVWEHTDGCKTYDDAWNGQPPVRCKAPPQERFTQRGQETRCDRSAPLAAGSHTNSWLLEKAIGTAYSFAFPGEALDYAPSTPDYEWVRFFWDAYIKPPTDHWLSSRNPVPVAPRNFVARVSNDGVLLSKLMCTMLSDRWPEILNKFSPECKNTWYHWAQRLRECCNTKPDLFHLGWVKLTDDAFDSKFQGRGEIFLKQMFEKHYGETIEIDRQSKGPTPNPYCVNMHHPQLFVDSHRDERQRQAMKEAIDVFNGGEEDQAYRIEAFLSNMVSVESAAFTPRGPLMCFRCLVRMEGSCKHDIFYFRCIFAIWFTFQWS